MELANALEGLSRAKRAGDAAEGERLGRLIVATYPDHCAALHFTAGALLALGRDDAAAEAFRAVLRHGPHAEAWSDFGLVLQRSGRIADSIRAYRAALALKRDLAPAVLNLAVALYQIGEFDEAYLLATRAAELLPDVPAVAAALAVIEGVRFDHARALERIEAALARTPGDVPLLLAAIYTLRRLERPAEAAGYARRLIEVGPPDGRAEEALSACLRDLGRHGEALVAADAAVARAPGSASAMANRGEVLLDLGDLVGAEAAFARALELDPQSVAAWHGRALVRPAGLGADDVAAMEALLTSPALVVREQRALLEFALGRTLLAAGRADEAFAHYAAGNRLHRASFHYDVAADEARAEAIVAGTPAAALARLAGAGHRGAAPIFVVGMPRSGTTLIEQILASHPEVHGAGELLVAREIIEGALRYPADVATLDPAQLAPLGERYVEALAARAPAGKRTVDKMPSNFLYAGMLHAMLPDARIVHCMRDPLDTGLSLYTELFSGRQDFAYDLSEIARYIRAYRRVVDHWRAVLPADAFLDVRYEDVVGDFDATIARLLTFCGLDWSDACRTFHATPRSIATASRVEVRRPLFSSSVGRGRRYAAYLQPLVDGLA